MVTKEDEKIMESLRIEAAENGANVEETDAEVV